MILAKWTPRFLRCRSWRYAKFSVIRNDQTRQRFDRLEAICCAYENAFAGEDPVRVRFRNTRRNLKRLFNAVSPPLTPPKFWSRAEWRIHEEEQRRFARSAKRISALVHQFHILFVRLAPFSLVESGINLALYDLKVIASGELYAKASRGLENYEFERDPQKWEEEVSPKEKEPAKQDRIRDRVIILIHETRRQSLALAQLEVLRDAVTRELLIAATRLLLLISVVVGLFLAFGGPPRETTMVSAGLMCAIGGIIGSVISSTIRISKMQENLDVSRAMALVAGVSRSIYYVPFIGCLVALVLFAFSLAGIDLGIIDFKLVSDGSGCGEADPYSAKLFFRSFSLGIAAGFSERLVHDLVDRFNGKPTTR